MSGVSRGDRLCVFQTTARTASWQRTSRTVSCKYRKNIPLAADGEPALWLIEQCTTAPVRCLSHPDCVPVMPGGLAGHEQDMERDGGSWHPGSCWGPVQDLCVWWLLAGWGRAGCPCSGGMSPTAHLALQPKHGCRGPNA